MSYKPCPFCGCRVNVSWSSFRNGRHPLSEDGYLEQCHIGCTRTECGVHPATQWCLTEEEAIEKWERRIGDIPSDDIPRDFVCFLEYSSFPVRLTKREDGAGWDKFLWGSGEWQFTDNVGDATAAEYFSNMGLVAVVNTAGISREH